VVLVQTTILATGERDHATDDCDRIGSDVHPNVEQHGYDMTPPLPKPDLEDHPHELWGQNVCSDFVTVEKMRAYGKACAAAERAACIAICDAEAGNSLLTGDLEGYYGTSAYAIANAIKARGTT